MTTLSQLLAVRDGVKAATHKAVTEAHREVQKLPLLNGVERRYQPKDDEGDRLPPESTRVQYTGTEAIVTVHRAMARLMDVQCTVDAANTVAGADVIVDGIVLLSNVPATFLLAMSKQLNDIYTFVAKLPVLDPAFTWTWSDTATAWASDPVQTTRSRKEPRNHVLAPATDKHPAQVQVYYEDVLVGTWTTIRLSGAVPAAYVKETLERIDKLREAVNVARTKANEVAVTDRQVGAAVMTYLFGTQTPR